jgi:hypothetical protein
MGLPGQPGQDGKDCKTPPKQKDFFFTGGGDNSHTEAPKFRSLTMDDIENVQKSSGTKPLPPPKKEHLLTTDALRPGQELKSGESMKIGDYSLSVRGCYFYIRLSGSGEDAPAISVHGPTYDRINGPCILSMQRDGNLVMYRPEGAVWSLRDSELKKTCPLGVTVDQRNGQLECQMS